MAMEVLQLFFIGTAVRVGVQLDHFTEVRTRWDVAMDFTTRVYFSNLLFSRPSQVIPAPAARPKIF